MHIVQRTHENMTLTEKLLGKLHLINADPSTQK
jgi:hypothetical protein